MMKNSKRVDRAHPSAGHLLSGRPTIPDTLETISLLITLPELAITTFQGQQDIPEDQRRRIRAGARESDISSSTLHDQTSGSRTL